MIIVDAFNFTANVRPPSSFGGTFVFLQYILWRNI